MMMDLSEFSHQAKVEADVCVIGAGIAGLLLTSRLSDRGLKILLVEAGAARLESRSQDLFTMDQLGKQNDGLTAGRFRVLGGSSTRWGGQLLPLQAIDFTPRPYVPMSGWPIALEDVAGYFAEIERLVNVDALPYDDTLRKSVRHQLPVLDSEFFQLRYSKWIPFGQRNLGRTLGKRCARLANVRVVLNAAATAVNLTPCQRRVRSVTLRGYDGREVTCTANRFVICCGAIESARLLLASRSVCPAGVGNRHDFVGRCFQDHLGILGATLDVPRGSRLMAQFEPFFVGRTMHTPRVEIRPEAQRRQQLLNMYGHWELEMDPESGVSAVRALLRSRQANELSVRAAARAVGLGLRDSLDLAWLAYRFVVMRRRSRPARSLLLLRIDCEQVPNPQSRVILTERLDALGMPRAALDWRITDQERQSVAAYVEAFDQLWRNQGEGRLTWNHDAIATPESFVACSQDTYHHLGTTRMGTDPRVSVVDRDLRVHGIDNLFIASTGVFPTSASSNPTFTMMALCLRLADQLTTNDAVPA